MWVPGPITDIAPADVAAAINITAFGGYLVVQEEARRMVKRGKGAILSTGASAQHQGLCRVCCFCHG